MSAATTPRRAALAALPLALAGASTGSAAAPSPVLRQALHVLALYQRETAACDALEAAADTPAEAGANAALSAAYDAWAAGMRDLAALPASSPHDVLVKLALVLWPLRDGPAPPEREAASAIMHDLWRTCPELRDLLRWTPQDALPPSIGPGF